MASLISTRIFTNSYRHFSVSARAMADFLIDGKYSFLKELGLNATNPGVYNGTWRGAGQVS